MKARPILFSGPKVRAILDGRETQTRRIVKLPPGRYGYYHDDGSAEWEFAPIDADGDCIHAPSTRVRSPYGKPGDRLWVKEVWGQANGVWEDWEYHRGTPDRALPIVYRADNPTHGSDDEYWRSPIYMPRWASRITLEVACVWVERVQDISVDDAEAEGYDCSGMQPACDDAARMWFRTLWDDIHSKHPERMWQANPYVWAVEFRRVD